MAGFKINVKRSAYLCVLLLCSCFSAPVEISINKKIKIDENIYQGHIKNLQNKIVQQIDSNNIICLGDFSKWLNEQFLDYRLPKRLIYARDYTVFKQCPPIDLEKEIPKAWRGLVKEGKITLIKASFNINKLREKLEKTPCIKNLIDPQNNNITLRSIKTKISGNTLNFDVPVFNIYYATRKLNQEETENFDAEHILRASGAIKLLGTTRVFRSGFTGFQDFDFVQDPEEHQAALKALQTLRANLIAFPEGLSHEPQVSLIDNKSYYIIPKGEAELNINLDILINMNLSNIGCVFKISENI